MKNKKKVARTILSAAVDLGAVLCLVALAAGVWRKVQHTYFAGESGSVVSGQAADPGGTVHAGDTADTENDAGGQNSGNMQSGVGFVQTGTWCTLKSNALDGVPIYPGAGEAFQSGLIPEGKCCELVGVTEYDGKPWAQVSYCGLTGWLKLKQLHFISADARYIRPGDTVYMNAITEKGISGYTEPSMSSEKAVDSLRYGEEFVIKELQNGWGLTQRDGKQFWINMYHMGSYPSDNWRVETLSSAAEINLREEPEEESRSLAKVPEDTVLTMKKYRNGWGRVQYNGQTGWVMLHYLTPVE